MREWLRGVLVCDEKRGQVRRGRVAGCGTEERKGAA